MDNSNSNRGSSSSPPSSAKARPERQPASPEEVDDAINLILEGFGGRAANVDKFRAYALALEGLPAEDIFRGVKAVLRGEVDDLDPAFPPTTAQLVQACRPLTFLSPGWVPLESLEQPELIEGPKSRVDAIVGAAAKAMTRHERDE